MENVTLTLDDATLRRARRIASERDTTLTEMVRNYLEQVTTDDQALCEQKAKDIRDSFDKFSRFMGGKNWVREDLYE